MPSLFTFNINDKRLVDLLGISLPNATVKIANTKLEASGPLLITHWGMSGPAVLKLSAFGARILADKNYQYNVEVNWLSRPTDKVLNVLLNLKKKEPRKTVILKSHFLEISKRLWERFVVAARIKPTQNWADLNNSQLENLANELTKGVFNANGRTTFKEEFVTAGGIDLKEINFKRFESKKHKCNKLSIISSANGIPLGIKLGCGNIHDIKLLIETLPKKTFFRVLYADKGYNSIKLKTMLLITRKIKLIYPYKKKSKR